MPGRLQAKGILTSVPQHGAPNMDAYSGPSNGLQVRLLKILPSKACQRLRLRRTVGALGRSSRWNRYHSLEFQLNTVDNSENPPMIRKPLC